MQDDVRNSSLSLALRQLGLLLYKLKRFVHRELWDKIFE